jgi:hypothetical protein
MKVGAASRISSHRNLTQQKSIPAVEESMKKYGNERLQESEDEDENGDKVEETMPAAIADTSLETEKYNEDEDRLFIFPPTSYRKSDRQLRVLMSRCEN